MEFWNVLLSVVNWICHTGVNEHVTAFVANNAVLVGPIGLYLFYRLKAKAAETPETWDDELVERIGKRLGLQQ